MCVASRYTLSVLQWYCVRDPQYACTFNAKINKKISTLPIKNPLNLFFFFFSYLSAIELNKWYECVCVCLCLFVCLHLGVLVSTRVHRTTHSQYSIVYCIIFSFTCVWSSCFFYRFKVQVENEFQPSWIYVYIHNKFYMSKHDSTQNRTPFFFFLIQ